MPRYRRLRWFFRQVLALPDAILAQSELNRGRYLELGAPAEKVRVAGNLKYDFDPARAGSRRRRFATFFDRVQARRGVDRRQHHAARGGRTIRTKTMP